MRRSGLPAKWIYWGVGGICIFTASILLLWSGDWVRAGIAVLFGQPFVLAALGGSQRLISGVLVITILVYLILLAFFLIEPA